MNFPFPILESGMTKRQPYPSLFSDNFYFAIVLECYLSTEFHLTSFWSGERQSTKMRITYLEAALNQDIPYFDTEVRTSDVVFAINTDAVMVQDAISEKVEKER